MSKLELLSPVGNFPMLVAAVKSGADAVYFGLKEFSMRASAKNFELSDLSKIRSICQESGRDVKMYVTLNTIIYEEELEKLEKLISKLNGKVDAVICWDLSVISLCKKYKIPFFISTQASVSNTQAAKFYKDLGAKRIVVARELNLEQVKRISKIIDVEAFAHGAMCVAISGRCFMSQFQFNKSANRGECLQPCRRSYIIKDSQEGKNFRLENSRVMSAKDLCTIPFMEKLKDAGVISFKIEGRNRDPRYVETVTRIYRKALDKKLTKKEIEESIKELEKIYNKGFSSGFYLGKPGKNDFSPIEHSLAKTKKNFVGKVVKYLPKISVALIKVSNDLKKGDELCFIGKSTGVIYEKANRIEISQNEVNSAKNGDEIGVKTKLVRKGDEVYVIVDTD